MAWTLLDHVVAPHAPGVFNTAVATVDSTGANLLFFFISAVAGNAPPATDDFGNVITYIPVSGVPPLWDAQSSGLYIGYCINPATVGAGHSVTFGPTGGNSYPQITFQAWLAPGVPTFNIAMGNQFGTVFVIGPMSAAIPPMSFVAAAGSISITAAIDFAFSTSWIINDGFTVIDPASLAGFTYPCWVAYKEHATGELSNPAWTRNNNSDIGYFVHIGMLAVTPAVCYGGGAITVDADPTAGETFVGRTLGVRSWLTLGFDDADRSLALDSYNHVESYHNGRKIGALISGASITRRLSDRFSSYKMADVQVEVDDTSRLLSTLESLAASEHWANRQVLLELASPATIAASGTPHTLFRGIWRAHQSRGFSRTLGFTDRLGSEFSDLNVEQSIPKRLIGELFDDAAGLGLQRNTTDPNALVTIKSAIQAGKANWPRPLPIAYGVLSDKTVSTIATVTVVPPIQPSLATLVAALQASVTSHTTVADWGAIIGLNDAVVLESLGTVPATYDDLAQVIGYSDLNYLLASMTASGGSSSTVISQIDSGKGKIAPPYVGYHTCADGVVRHMWVIAASAIQHVEGRYFDGIAFSADEPDYHDIESADWATVSGTANRWMVLGGGQTVVPIFMDRGARGDAVATGAAKLTLNICAIEDVGDGTGSVITDAPRVAYHLLEQWVLQDYQTGAWLSAATSDDGVPWLNSASFYALEAIETQRIGGCYQAAIYLDELISVRELLSRLLSNFDIHFGPNQYGQVIAIHLDEFVNLAAAQHVSDAAEIVQETSIDRRLAELENKVVYDWNYRSADRTFEVTDAEVLDAQAVIDNLNRETVGDHRQFFYVLDRATAEDVAWRALLRGKHPPRYVDVVGPIHLLRISLGSVITVSDVDGVGATGWVDRPLWVIGVVVSLKTLDEAPTVTLECVDVLEFMSAASLAHAQPLAVQLSESAFVNGRPRFSESLRVRLSEAAVVVATSP